MERPVPPNATSQVERSDFIGSMFMAYTGTVIVVGTPVLLLGLLTDIGLTELLLLGLAAPSFSSCSSTGTCGASGWAFSSC